MSDREDMRAEHSQAGTGQPWVPILRRVDAALAAGNDSTAERAWHDACAVALRARTWQALLAVGDAYQRIGDAAMRETMADALVSQLYRSALLCAVRDRSIEGVLRSAERFTALGDEAGAEEGLAVAEQFVERSEDPAARERLAAIRAGWADHWLTAAATA